MEIFADFAYPAPPMPPTVAASVPAVNAYHCPPPPAVPDPDVIQYDYSKARDYPKHQYLFPYSVRKLLLKENLYVQLDLHS